MGAIREAGTESLMRLFLGAWTQTPGSSLTERASHVEHTEDQDRTGKMRYSLMLGTRFSTVPGITLRLSTEVPPRSLENNRVSLKAIRLSCLHQVLQSSGADYTTELG